MMYTSLILTGPRRKSIQLQEHLVALNSENIVRDLLNRSVTQPVFSFFFLNTTVQLNSQEYIETHD